MKLKIYSDQSYLPRGCPHVQMLYPFWGKTPEVGRPTVLKATVDNIRAHG